MYSVRGHKARQVIARLLAKMYLQTLPLRLAELAAHGAEVDML
jgi:hypothetical protein